jgi:hypothetical protein
MSSTTFGQDTIDYYISAYKKGFKYLVQIMLINMKVLASLKRLEKR